MLSFFIDMDIDPSIDLDPRDAPAEHGPHGSWHDALSTIGIVIMAPIVALFLTAFVFQSYQVDGPSMEPTLSDKDRLIVTKVGKTWSRLSGTDYLPDRYDIIIFNQTGTFDGGAETEKQLVKRVIGLPGDRMVVKDGVIRVFNAQHPDGFLVDSEGPEKDSISNTDGNVDLVVPSGEIYVVGDNRDNSMDSRQFGPIKTKDVVGKLSLRIYPFDDFDKF